ncbi:50S ribosomal protein L10 [bacterium]|nr:50S ribosomal protein L10 [bacterium]
MAKPGKAAKKRRGRSPKVRAISELERLFQDGDGLVFFDNKGLTVEEATELRALLRKEGATMKVAKNTFIKRAMATAGIEMNGLEDKLTGPTVVAFGLKDAVSPAKVLSKYAEDHGERFEIKAGLLGGEILDAKGVDALSKMPSREELLGRMLGSMQAPAQNVVYALNQTVSKVVYAVSALQRKLEEGDAA